LRIKEQETHLTLHEHYAAAAAAAAAADDDDDAYELPALCAYFIY